MFKTYIHTHTQFSDSSFKFRCSLTSHSLLEHEDILYFSFFLNVSKVLDCFFIHHFTYPQQTPFTFSYLAPPKSLVWSSRLTQPQLFSAYFTKRKVVIQCDFQIFSTYGFNYLYSYLLSLLSQMKDIAIFSKIHCMHDSAVFFLKLSFNILFFIFIVYRFLPFCLQACLYALHPQKHKKSLVVLHKFSFTIQPDHKNASKFLANFSLPNHSLILCSLYFILTQPNKSFLTKVNQ